MPDHPKPTHSSQPLLTGLKPWTTINETIANIPSGWHNHDIGKATQLERMPTNGDTQANCMTTGGGGLSHPSGKRSFTPREFACLQGFPLEHKFGDRSVVKQIGNAVPPIVGVHFIEGIKRALMKADGIQVSATR